MAQPIVLSQPRIGASSIQARRTQQLRRVLIPLPSLCLIHAGRKRLWLGEQTLSVESGDCLLLPAGAELDVENLPGLQGYRADIVSLPVAVVEEFRHRYGGHLALDEAAHGLARWRVASTERLAQAWRHLIESVQRSDAEPLQWLHAHEVLLVLALDGRLGPLLPAPQDSTSDRVRQWLMQNPAADWSLDLLAERLCTSATTLRRKLKREGHGFRQIIEDVRLTHALHQVQTSRLPISRIAQACGYASASRFAVRFRQRYGLSPSGLRQTM